MSDARSDSFASELPAAEHRAAVAGHRSSRRHRRSPVRWFAPLIGLLAAAALASVFWQPQSPSLTGHGTAASATAAESATAPLAASDKARYPIFAPNAPQPPLDASDAPIEVALRALIAGGAVTAILAPPDLVRSVVATVDNLPRRSLFSAKMPVRPAPGPFQTTFAATGLAIADANASRYAPYVRLLDGLDAAKLVALYRRHYPLFAQAYRDLGYPNGHFNDRLVEAIEIALNTPQVDPPLRVVQPKVHYEYVDRDLETLPAAQKLMLRMGPENAAIVRAKLAEFHALLTRNAADAVAAR